MEDLPQIKVFQVLNEKPFSPNGTIVSLVPSLTELLFYLGLGDRVIGVTQYCIHPIEAKLNAKVLAGTKNFSTKAILELKPQFVIVNREENPKERTEKLLQHLPLVLTDISKPEDLVPLLHFLTKTYPDCASKALKLEIELKQLSEKLNHLGSGSVLYLIWNKPIMAVGGDTFISKQLELAGFTNITKQLNRYPVLTPEKLSSLNPDYLFLSSEPYPFKQEHIVYFQELLPKTKILLVDGEPFSWYGNRMLNLPNYIKTLNLPPITS